MPVMEADEARIVKLQLRLSQALSELGDGKDPKEVNSSLIRDIVSLFDDEDPEAPPGSALGDALDAMDQAMDEAMDRINAKEPLDKVITRLISDLTKCRDIYLSQRPKP